MLNYLEDINKILASKYTLNILRYTAELRSRALAHGRGFAAFCHYHFFIN